MPWPKGRKHTPEMVAKRIRSFVASGAKRKVPINGLWRCPACRILRPADEFCRSKRTLTGFTSDCRWCHSRVAQATRDPNRHRRNRVIAEANRRGRASGGRVGPSDLDKLTEILGQRCLACGSTRSVQWDHVVPLARGGRHHPTNLQPLCGTCNVIKQARFREYRSAEQIAAVGCVWCLSFRRVEPVAGGEAS